MFYKYSNTLIIRDLISGIIFVLLGVFLILEGSGKMKKIENKKI